MDGEVIVIDLSSNDVKKYQTQLLAFLAKPANITNFYSDQSLIHNFEDGTQFRFDHIAYEYPRKLGKEGRRFACVRLDKKSYIGKGAYGRVYKNLVTLQASSDYKTLASLPYAGPADQKSKKRVTKLGDIKNDPQSYVMREYQSAGRIPYTKMKYPYLHEGKKLYFICMAYLPGQELLEILNTGQLKHFSMQGLLDLSIDTLKALNGIHERNIIHRDIKPENILVDLKGEEVKSLSIIDFNLAVEVGANVRSAGSKVYYPPEALMAEIQQPTKAWDIYSAGRSLAYLFGRFRWDLPEQDDYLTMRFYTMSAVRDLNSEDSVYRDPKYQLVGWVLSNMLNSNPTKRLTADGAIRQFEVIKTAYLMPQMEFYLSRFISPNDLQLIKAEMLKLKEWQTNLYPIDIGLPEKFLKERKQSLSLMALIDQKLKCLGIKAELITPIPKPISTKTETTTPNERSISPLRNRNIRNSRIGKTRWSFYGSSIDFERAESHLKVTKVASGS